MTSEQNLKAGFTEFLEGGLDEEAKSRYKLAVTAYFKALTQLCDLILLRKQGYAPSSHHERFRRLEQSFPSIYLSIDGLFKTYQDTYSIPLTKESCLTIKNEIKNFLRQEKLDQEFSSALSKIQK